MRKGWSANGLVNYDPPARRNRGATTQLSRAFRDLRRAPGARVYTFRLPVVGRQTWGPCAEVTLTVRGEVS